ncbi:MAG: hypothetical protein LBL66_00525, partial [Clostridiales bacterium]|nr:hypothetical protein [Clostridiales bacterium]
NRLVAKLRRETIGEGFLRVIRVKIAVCSNATNKIFTCITCNKDPHSVRVVFRNKSIGALVPTIGHKVVNSRISAAIAISLFAGFSIYRQFPPPS